MFIYLFKFIYKQTTKFINVPVVERHVFTIYLYFFVSPLLNVKEHGCVIIHARAKNEGCLLYIYIYFYYLFICLHSNIFTHILLNKFLDFSNEETIHLANAN